jgi:cystathionine gamma-synthase
MTEQDRNLGPGTRAVWGGEEQLSWQGATQVPVVHSVTFGFDDLDTWLAVGAGREPGHIYSRNTNPTVEVFEQKMRVLEDAEAATSFATGMAAISNVFFALLAPGRRVVSIRDTYGGTSRILLEFLPRWNVDVELCETTDHEAIEAAISRGCDLLYLESPTNPAIKVLDLARHAARAHEVGAIVVVDNTFATPLNQQPLALGADLVLHSATKFLGGHGDVLGGVVCGSEELVGEVYGFREIVGTGLDAQAAALMLRSLKTLGLRIERHNANALAVARYLEGHDKIAAVAYPGLESHPMHEVAKAQMSGFGGMLAFEMSGGEPAVRQLLPQLDHAYLAANLGQVETIVGPPSTTSHVELSDDERRAAGIPDGLVRYSAGIEDAEDLIADLERSLEKVDA